jgi:hypothetical protein
MSMMMDELHEALPLHLQELPLRIVIHAFVQSILKAESVEHLSCGLSRGNTVFNEMCELLQQSKEYRDRLTEPTHPLEHDEGTC